MLNGIDALIIFGAIVFAIHNIIRYIIIGKIRTFFIVMFYVLAVFSLVAWIITSLYQCYNPGQRYLVF